MFALNPYTQNTQTRTRAQTTVKINYRNLLKAVFVVARSLPSQLSDSVAYPETPSGFGVVQTSSSVVGRQQLAWIWSTFAKEHKMPFKFTRRPTLTYFSLRQPACILHNGIINFTMPSAQYSDDKSSGVIRLSTKCRTYVCAHSYFG